MKKRVIANQLDRNEGPLWRRIQRLKFQIQHPLRYRALRNQCRGTGIFVHIPKCAGTSLREGLRLPLGGHATLIDYQLRLPPEDFEKAFKFTFVRNPWDRLASAFFFLKNRDLKSNQKWAEKNLSAYNDFDSFVRQWVTTKNVWSYSHFRPQFYFVSMEDRRPAVDFVGFYENLSEDFSMLCEKMKLSANLREENRNARRTTDYRENYTNETRRIVAEVYAEDIRLFDYDFHNSKLPQQIAARNRRANSSLPTNGKRAA